MRDEKNHCRAIWVVAILENRINTVAVRRKRITFILDLYEEFFHFFGSAPNEIRDRFFPLAPPNELKTNVLLVPRGWGMLSHPC